MRAAFVGALLLAAQLATAAEPRTEYELRLLPGSTLAPSHNRRITPGQFPFAVASLEIFQTGLPRDAVPMIGDENLFHVKSPLGALAPGFYGDSVQFARTLDHPELWSPLPCSVRDLGSFTVLDAELDYTRLPARYRRFAVRFRTDNCNDTPGGEGWYYLNYAPAVGVALSPSEPVAEGETVTLRLSLEQPAPAGGTIVQLVSDAPETIAVPESVTIPAGATSLEVPLIAGPAWDDRTVQILAIVDGIGSVAETRVLAAAKPLTLAEVDVFRADGTLLRSVRVTDQDAFWLFRLLPGRDAEPPAAGFLHLRALAHDRERAVIVTLATPLGRSYPGTFINATRFYERATGSFYVDLPGSGCEQERFTNYTVSELAVDFTREPFRVMRLAVSWEQRCVSPTGPLTTRGRIFYRYLPPRGRTAGRR